MKGQALRIRDWIIVAVALVTFVAIWFANVMPVPPPRPEISYSEFRELVSARKMDEVVMRGDAMDGHLISADQFNGSRPTQTVVTHLPPVPDAKLLELLETSGVKVTSRPPTESGAFGWLLGLLPWIFLLGLYLFLMPRLTGGMAGGLGRGGFNRLVGRDGKSEADKPTVRFKDVAGQENAKREVAELVDFLRQPDRYRRLGAEPPRGILLMGAPGTGKTLLARALAGEADVPFFSISASEFIEVFVGVGASRVRALFADAKKNAPSIVFIDELDSVGRVRGTGFGGGNDEREQTLNQILAELDGFSGHEAVVVLAATNRPDVLDPALLRPGRFDRHITLELPDKKARVEILTVHVRNVPLAEDVDLDTIARATPGFSGADLKNLVNEAAMAAARENSPKVARRHFEIMRDRVLMGSERALALSPEDKHRLAVHESGHAVCAYFTANADPLFKVSIVPRGRSLGETQQLPEGERYIMSEDYLQSRIATMLGGRAAERLVLGTVSSGADDDIRQATQLARMMVSRWGMSDAVGPIDVRESDEHPFLGRTMAQPRQVSEATAHDVDHAVRQILTTADESAKAILSGHRDVYDSLVQALEESETLEKSDIDAILGAAAESRSRTFPVAVVS